MNLEWIKKNVLILIFYDGPLWYCSSVFAPCGIRQCCRRLGNTAFDHSSLHVTPVCPNRASASTISLWICAYTHDHSFSLLTWTPKIEVAFTSETSATLPFNTMQITKTNINLKREAMRTFLNLFIQNPIVAYTREDYSLLACYYR